MDINNFIILAAGIATLGNILIRGIIDILAYLKKKRQEQAEKDKQMEKTEQAQ
jgi:hypothetical protein